MASASAECRAIAFCGVHFMAETADILANRPEKLAAAAASASPSCCPTWPPVVRWPTWPASRRSKTAGGTRRVHRHRGHHAGHVHQQRREPQAFLRQHGGIVCTSSNAAAVLEWAFERKSRVLFFPDQHLGRNTAKAMGIPLDQMCVWNPHEAERGGNTAEQLQRSKVLLWQGHCSVHAMFRPEHVDQFRAKYPDIKILVHPECAMEVCDKSDVKGSTSKIIQTVEQAPPGTKWAIGTELHLVNR